MHKIRGRWRKTCKIVFDEGGRGGGGSRGITFIFFLHFGQLFSILSNYLAYLGGGRYKGFCMRVFSSIKILCIDRFRVLHE